MYLKRENTISQNLIEKQQLLEKYKLPDTTGKGYSDEVESRIVKLKVYEDIKGKMRHVSKQWNNILLASSEEDYAIALKQYLKTSACIHFYNLFILKNNEIEVVNKIVNDNFKTESLYEYIETVLFPIVSDEIYSQHI